MRLFEQPAHVLHDMLVKKEITSVELTQDVLARMDEVEGDVKAYLHMTKDAALAQAKAVDEKIAKGVRRLKLHVEKKLKCTEGV